MIKRLTLFASMLRSRGGTTQRLFRNKSEEQPLVSIFKPTLTTSTSSPSRALVPRPSGGCLRLRARREFLGLPASYRAFLELARTSSNSLQRTGARRPVPRVSLDDEKVQLGFRGVGIRPRGGSHCATRGLKHRKLTWYGSVDSPASDSPNPLAGLLSSAGSSTHRLALPAHHPARGSSAPTLRLCLH